MLLDAVREYLLHQGPAQQRKPKYGDDKDDDDDSNNSNNKNKEDVLCTACNARLKKKNWVHCHRKKQPSLVSEGKRDTPGKDP